MAQKNKRNYSSYKKHLHGKKQVRSRGHLKAEEIYSLEEANDRLYDIFINHGFKDFSHDKRQQLAQYYKLLMEEQNRQNFTRIFKFRDIAIKQFIDSMIIGTLTELKFPLMDVGTGPGLPGIPLKIMFPEKQMYLAEGVQKRVEFLKNVRQELSLEKLGIFGRNINQQFVYPVMGIVTRAVEEMNNTLENCFHCLQTGGRVYFMKGPNADEELSLIDPKWKEYYKLIDDIHYDLPKTPHKRRLIIFEKVKTAPLQNMEFFLDEDV